MHAAYTRASPTHAQVTTSHHRGQTHTTLTITYTVRCRMIIYLSSLDHYFCCGVTAHVIGTPKGISGFGGLVSLNTLTITNNPTLQSVTGFGAVQSVVLLTISDNKSLTSLAGVRARHACSDQHHALCLRINARGTHFTTRAAGGPRVCVCVCVYQPSDLSLSSLTLFVDRSTFGVLSCRRSRRLVFSGSSSTRV